MANRHPFFTAILATALMLRVAGTPILAGGDDGGRDSLGDAKRCWIEPWSCKDPPERPPVVDPPLPQKRCWIEPWYCKPPHHPHDVDPAGPNEVAPPPNFAH